MTDWAIPRVGLGFDVHAFDAERSLVLGGIEIPGAPGLAGHSDADVVCHALGDAVLGAAGLGDLGTHFPDSDERWAGVSGLEILRRVRDLALGVGLRAASIDATVLLERPRLAPYTARMREVLAEALDVDPARVGVKATTTEGLGTVGRGEGAACLAVAVLVSVSPGGPPPPA